MNGPPSGRIRVSDVVGSSRLPDHEAMRLLKRAFGETDRAGLLVPHRLVPEPVRDEFGRLARLRLEGHPLQYLEGSVPFGGVELMVDERVLVPRPETEYLWEVLVRELADRPPSIVVDLCTGSGALALALKNSFPDAEVFGTDISAEALELAGANGDRSGLAVSWLRGDLFDALPEELVGNVDLLVANPPYVSDEEFRELPVDVREHEPRRALVAGPSGSEILDRIAVDAARWLSPRGLLAVEIAEARSSRVVAAMSHLGGHALVDLTGRRRYVMGGGHFATGRSGGEIRP